MATLLWGVIFGSVGMGYIVYGRKQSNGVALVSGIVLCVFPYFVSNWILLVAAGVLLMSVPFLVKW